MPDWFFDNLFLGTFTLAGAYFGATIAGKHAVNLMREQQNLLKREKIDDQNFEFRKRYADVQRGVYLSLTRMKHLIDGKLKRNDIDGVIELNKVTRERLKGIATDIISEEKYDAFIECLELLQSFEMALEWFKDGIIPSGGEIEYYREELFKANNKLKE